jgi:xanthine dehydrogenase small subunit
MTQAIRVYHRGRWHGITDAAPDRTVLEWLREDLGACGTKEGCNEGDCGACTVVIGSLRADGTLQLQPINSCIRLLPTLHGHALWTVEDLAAPDGRLHPCQQAMVDLHGSQCGFCTPGFVMSLWALYQRSAQYPGREPVEQALAGNLCRCTGYRPIVDAARAMYALPRVPLDADAAARALAAVPADEDFAYTHDGVTFHAPATLARLSALRREFPQARLLAGSTDVGLWVTKQHRSFERWIWLGRVRELERIGQRDGMLEIGAGASLEAAYAALAAHWPQWSELQARFASLPIREMGTLGGNVANGSPIGDSMPGLLALNAQVVLTGAQGERQLPLHEFYLGYQKNAMRADEFLRAVRVPLPRAGGDGARQFFRTYKLSKRTDQDISAVCCGLSVVIHNGVVRQVRIGFGGMAAIPARASRAEAALEGQRFTREAWAAAVDSLGEDFTPLSDMRASAAYRLAGARGHLWRAFEEIGAELGGLAVPLTLERLLAQWQAEQAREAGA